MKQTTLSGEFTVSGVGLHLGEEATVTVKPAVANTGYRFFSGSDEGLVRPWYIDGSKHRSILKLRKGTEINTVEHILAALYGMGVDNAVIEVEGSEIPGTDGSSLEFATKIAEVGVVDLEDEAEYYKLKKDASAGAAGCSITATPIKENELRITYMIDYKESSLARGVIEKVITPEIFLKEIAPARTFVMQSEVESLQSAGFGKGANTQNTLVLDGDEVVNNTLRVDSEPAAHKILDIIGDLACTGVRLGAHIVACKSGHALNKKFAENIRMDAMESLYPDGVMTIKDIRTKMPHRYPFQLVDRVIELEAGQRVVAYKNLTSNEEFFNGHFPGQPIMPGVLQIEALAQVGGLGMAASDIDGKLAVLTGVDSVKFRRQVIPGDKLLLEAKVLKYNGRLGSIEAKASVNGELSCSAVIKFAFIPRDKPGM